MDIVDSLREIVDGKRVGVKVMPFAATIHDAADEIERLREALKSISKIPNSESAYGIIQVFVDDALKEKE